MAEGFRIDASWLDALDRHVEGLQHNVIAAADAAVDSYHEAMVDYAKSKPAWVGLADNIQVWSNDGYLVVGLQGDDYVSQAEALEYGDLENPPDSLFRTADHVAAHARDRLLEELGRNRPIKIPGVRL